MFSTQHAFTGQSCVCISELTAADSITQLLLTALTSTRLIDMQGAEGEAGERETLGDGVEEEKEKQNEKCARVKEGENKSEGLIEDRLKQKAKETEERRISG